MIYTKPINVLHLFNDLNNELIKVLSNASEVDLYKPTICEKWNVKDIAQHILKDYIHFNTKVTKINIINGKKVY